MKHKYIWINCDKKEYLDAVDFNEPVNIKGYYRNPNKTNNALFCLLTSHWKNSHIVLISNDWEEEYENEIVRSFRSTYDDIKYLNNLWLFAKEEFKNMRSVFDENYKASDTAFYAYVINHTKKEFFRRKSIRDKNNWFSPISFLLISGKDYYSGKYGYWIGDDIEVVHKPDNYISNNYKNVTSLYTYSYFLGCSEEMNRE